MDRQDSVLDLKEFLHPTTVPKFINMCLLHVLEHNQKERRCTGTLMKEMVKRKLFTSDHILAGFEEILQSAEDFIVDIPKLWEYLAQLVEPVFEEGVVNMSFLGTLAASLTDSSLAPKLIAATLKELVHSQVTIWIVSFPFLGQDRLRCTFVSTSLTHDESEWQKRVPNQKRLGENRGVEFDWFGPIYLEKSIPCS